MAVALREHAGDVEPAVVDLRHAQDDLDVDAGDAFGDGADVENARQHGNCSKAIGCPSDRMRLHGKTVP
jgi:hypothetical protein